VGRGVLWVRVEAGGGKLIVQIRRYKVEEAAQTSTRKTLKILAGEMSILEV
jgi:hypothetical protein